MPERGLVSEEVYRRLSEHAERLQLTPKQMAERLLVRDLVELTEDDGVLEPPFLLAASAEALAAVRRMTTLFADASIGDLEQALADPMLALANADLAGFQQ
jgi:hypothetical protein